MRVRATSLNYRDLMVLKGGGRGPTKLGVIPLSDGAGEVASIGDGVTRVKIGDRVAGCFHPRWFGGPISPDYLTDRLGANLDGMLAEYAVLSEEALVHIPSHLSFEEAATVFADPEALDWADTEHSGDEQRSKRLGKSGLRRILLLVYTIRRMKDGKETIRIISARQASRKERAAYSELPD